MQVLVIEDEKLAAVRLIEMITGLEPTAKILKPVESVRAATQWLKTHPQPDLIMMDIRMPDMDGYEAIRRIRQFNTSVVIIAQTAFALTGDREKALEAGCNDYISKPYGKTLLKELVKKHLKK